jgi:mono/diheme cytochrome c family protein
MRWHVCLGFALLLGVAVLGAAPQTTGSKTPPLMISSVAGRDLYEFYCATCHGRDGKGHGPVAAALNVLPADLTFIARRSGGRFPTALVEEYVTNGGDVLIAAHGTTDMPVWGPVFRGLDPSDTLVKIRIANVVKHVESLQMK